MPCSGCGESSAGWLGGKRISRASKLACPLRMRLQNGTSGKLAIASGLRAARPSSVAGRSQSITPAPRSVRKLAMAPPTSGVIATRRSPAAISSSASATASVGKDTVALLLLFDLLVRHHRVEAQQLAPDRRQLVPHALRHLDLHLRPVQPAAAVAEHDHGPRRVGEIRRAA